MDDVRGEWRRHWTVDLGGMMGYSCIGLQTFAFGPFVVAIQSEFGWSRAAVMSGLTMMSGLGIGLNILGGVAVDKFGSRRVALLGQILLCGAFAAVSRATGSTMDWVMHWSLMAVAIALMQGPTWTGMVAQLFSRGRGLAIAAVLTGSSVTAAVTPLLATALLQGVGWRMALVGTSLIWLAVTFPLSAALFIARKALSG